LIRSTVALVYKNVSQRRVGLGRYDFFAAGTKKPASDREAGRIAGARRIYFAPVLMK
jgi:hypothetical protein